MTASTLWRQSTLGTACAHLPGPQAPRTEREPYLSSAFHLLRRILRLAVRAVSEPQSRSRWQPMAMGLMLLLGLHGAASAQQIAFTWDDLPAHSALPEGQTRLGIIQAILSAMKAQHMPPVYGFVNGVQLEREPGTGAVLEAWRAAGNPLGNHTWSHMNLNEHTAAAFEADALRNEPVLQRYAGSSDWHWFRYPFLAEGKDATQHAEVRTWLALQGYRVAAVTMSFEDYAWNEPYARCVAKGDTAAIDQMKASYLKAAAEDAKRRRAMAKTLYGHDIPYVLLMHVGALDAQMLPQLLAQYRAAGFIFVTLEQAEADPFYHADLNLTSEPGPTTLEAALMARHLPVPAADALPDFANVCRTAQK